MKTPFRLITGFLLCVLLPFTICAEDASELKLKEVMALKLTQAQRILRGLATEDYKLIQNSAEKLKDLSQTSAWLSRTSPDYLTLTRDFRRHVASIQKGAKDHNIDSITVAYFQMTVSCVQCHRHLRGSERASVDPTSIPGIELLAHLNKDAQTARKTP